jgi:hypothetical protein
MSDVSGPCSTLPGSAHAVPDGAPCDDHPDRLAVVRIQGETDSMGAEFHDLCLQCADAMRVAIYADRNGVCDWCSKPATDLRNRRDFEEGSCGPVYRVCGACVRKEYESLREDDE